MILALVDDMRVDPGQARRPPAQHADAGLPRPDEAPRGHRRETLEIYAPIANRLGMGRIKGELEDLAFRYLEPEEFARAGAGRSSAKLKARRRSIEQIQRATRGEARRGRHRGRDHAAGVKRLYSICEKLRAPRIDVAQLYDYLAFRDRAPETRDCYAALGLVHQLWRPVPGRIKDYIAMPKPNVYQSLHTTVMGDDGQPFEVQIRTREMDLIAERGIAAHWQYKEGKARPDRPTTRDIRWLRQLARLADARCRTRASSSTRSRSTSIRTRSTPSRRRARSSPSRAARRRSTSPTGSTPRSATTASGARINGAGAAAHGARERRHRRDPDRPRTRAPPATGCPSS